MLKLTQRILRHAIMGIALLTLFSCKNAANNNAPLTAVFILAGQSNMAGEAWIDEAPADYYPLPTNVELYDFTQKFDYKAHAAWRETHEPRDAAEFVSTRPSGQFGPELGFAATISDAYPNRKFIFIKWAMGGSSQQEWSPQWDANNFAPNSVEAIRGALFQQAVHAIKSVGLQNEPHEFAGLLWFQGEKDSKSFTAASAYEENMKTLITAFRDELDAPEMPIFIGKVNPLTERHTYVPRVHEGMEKLAAHTPNIVLISADGLSKQPDNVHYDAAGLIELGERFGAAWLATQKGEN